MTENFNILVNKLSAFQIRYYTYRLLKGIIVTVGLLLTVYTVFSVIEYFAFMPREVRTFLFFGFLVFAALLIITFIFVPVLRLLRIVKPISLKSSTVLIQNHFTDIQDKLLNIIELSENDNLAASNDLVLASIDQKINELKVFDFKEAVRFTHLKIISIYLIISVLVSSSLFLVNRNYFADSTYRIVHYNQQFVKPAPFAFELKNTTLKAKKGEAFLVVAEAVGDEIPQIAYINIEGNNFLMKKVAEGRFQFEIASVINPINFYFTDLKYNSEQYFLELLPKPGINSFSTEIIPPSYTKQKKQVVENIGDLQVPRGTMVKWLFNGTDVDSLYLMFDDSLKLSAKQTTTGFQAEKVFFEPGGYHVYIQNKLTVPELSLSYFVDVIPDLFPEIKVIEVQDSIKITRFFYKGLIGDDYGFSSLQFHMHIADNDSVIDLPFVRSMNDQEFYFSFDFSNLPQPEGVVSYYFSVSDSDALSGFKNTTSESYTFRFPSNEVLEAFDKEQFQNLEKKFQKSRQLANDIQNDIKNLQLKNMDSSVSDWEKSQMVNDIVQKQSRLEQLYNEIKQDNERLNNFMNSFDDKSAETLEKQQQIEQLLEEVFTDELKKLMEEFNKLADDFDSKKLNELTQNMNLSFDDLQEQLDRNIEMLKKMKVEQSLQEVIDEISNIAAEVEELAKEVSDKKNFEDVLQKSAGYKEDLERLQNKVHESLELNNSLEKPLNFDDFDEEFQNVEEGFHQSEDFLQKRNKKKSGSSLNNTSEKMKSMAFSMQHMLDSNSAEQNMENIQNLKQILSNLMYISFTQEDILNNLSDVNSKDPRLIDLNQEQKRIINQSNIVKDSLYALAKRTPQLSSTVNNELLSMEMNLAKSASLMEEALFPQAAAAQQFVVTSANNLALLLNEALDNLEKQRANAQPGDQQCENPGGQGSPGLPDLKESSESLQKQLEKMIEQMKNGGGKGMTQQLGQSLMQHEMMQQMLRDLMNNGSVGSGAKSTLQQIDELLEENRKELMNRSISAETLKRQHLITSRLLEAEKAEMEREFEDKRESESAQEFYSNPVEFFEYINKETQSIEYINKNAHQLSNFYHTKYKQYLNNVHLKP